MKKQATTKFEEKQIQLDRIKADFRRHQSRLNILKLQYRDWFDRQFQSFVDGVKVVQMAYPFLIPKEIKSMNHFIETLKFVQGLPRNGNNIGRHVDKMAQFLRFWSTFTELKNEGQMLNKIMCEFCDSITRLREPELRLDIHDMQARLDETSLVDFNFLHLHNERDNLFVYRVALHDDKFHALIGYLPYLLKLATGISYWSGKLYLEKE